MRLLFLVIKKQSQHLWVVPDFISGSCYMFFSFLFLTRYCVHVRMYKNLIFSFLTIVQVTLVQACVCVSVELFFLQLSAALNFFAQ